MATSGYLSDFSLPELFQFIEQGRKTGLLTIRPGERADASDEHFIWLHQGQIVACSERTDHRGLVSLISERGWLNQHSAVKLGDRCPVGTPIGLCLKSHGVLSAEQLQLLFRTQLRQGVFALFDAVQGAFELDTGVVLPMVEMTGLSLRATEATLLGLRGLRDWSPLADKLPHAGFALVRKQRGQPTLRLDALETQVWELIDRDTSLQAIARQLHQPVDLIQRVAFRLIACDLAEEVPMVEALPEPPPSPRRPVVASDEPDGRQAAVSQSFLKNLVGFLRSKL